MSRVVPSYTILDPTLNDIPSIGVGRQPNGSGGFDTVLTMNYVLKADDPSITRVDQLYSAISFDLNASAKSKLLELVTLIDAINAIKTQEGL